MSITTASMNAYVDPAALLQVRSLELRARLVMEGLAKGLHRSSHHGFSAEFSEYRAYAPGDDPRMIDWKAVARSDRWFVKKFDEETNLRCQLVLDVSGSMSYGSAGYNKVAYAATMAATLAMFLFQQADAVGISLLDQHLVEHVPARRRPGQLHALLLRLQQAVEGASRPTRSAEGSDADFIQNLSVLPTLLRRRALLVLLSDFLMPLDTLERQLSLLTAMGHEILVLRVVDPAELNFPYTEASVFEDPETGLRRTIDPGVERARYQERWRLHETRLRAICASTHAAFRQMVTDQPLGQFLFEYLSTQQRRTNMRNRRR